MEENFEELADVRFCKNCRAEISIEKYNQAIKEKRLPLCEKCQPIIEKKLKEWYPKFAQFKF